MSPGLFRLLLASVVVVSHFSKLAIGTAAVHLFFALSGYWIYRMYAAKYRLAKYPELLFVASRLMRLLPVFLLFNTIAWLIHVGWGDRVAQATTGWAWIPNVLILGYASLPRHPMVPAWSLDIELQFYLLFPLIFPLLRSSPSRSWWLGGLLLLVGGCYMGVFTQTDAVYVLPYGGFFLLGVVMAQIRTPPSPWLVRCTTALCAASLGAILLNPAWRGLAVHSVDAAEFEWNTGLNFALALLLTPFALSTVFRRSTNLDRTLGELSYVVYCSHWIGVMLATELLSEASRWVKAPLIAGMLVLTYAVSLLVLEYIDRPIGRWRERWIKGVIYPAGDVREAAALP